MRTRCEIKSQYAASGLVVVCVSLAFALVQSTPGFAQESAPSLVFGLAKIRTLGILPENIKSALYLDLENIPAAMTVADPEATTALDVRSVQFNGQHNPGVWLRTRCTGAKKTFTLEECRGSVCTPTASAKGSDNPRHRRVFQGDFARYSLSRAGFDKQSLESGSFDARICQRSWPTWALTARALSQHAELEVPRHLLLLQTAERVYFFDALRKRIWNSFAWNETRGIFSHLTVSTDGRLLLKNHSGDALILSFAEAQYFALSRGVVTTSLHGLNSLFSSNSASNEVQLDLQKQDNGLVDVTMGGIWWKNGFLNWKDIALSLALKNPSMLREYPNSSSLNAVTWSEESGVEKSYLLLQAGSRLELHTSPDAKLFVKVKSYALDEQNTGTERYFIHPEFLTRLISQGIIGVKEGDAPFYQDSRINENSSGVQNSLDILTHSKTPDGQKCHVAYFAPRAESVGWLQKHVFKHSSCSTGLGRGPTSAGLVEIKGDTIKLYSIK